MSALITGVSSVKFHASPHFAKTSLAGSSVLLCDVASDSWT